MWSVTKHVRAEFFIKLAKNWVFYKIDLVFYKYDYILIETPGQIFFRRDMFKKYMEEDQRKVKEFDTDFMEEESMNLLANIDGV